MKNIILIIGALLIALNTLIGLMISGYPTQNFMLANLSLALSACVVYFAANSKMANGFKIGLTILFFFTGIIRFFCVALAPERLENNAAFIAAIVILFIEIICLSASIMVSKKHKI